MQEVSAKGPFTLAGLNRIQLELAIPFVKGYEALVAKVVVDVHCTAIMARQLVSTTFPKLHLLLHLCQQVADLGHVWYWNTGELFCAGRVPSHAGRGEGGGCLLVCWGLGMGRWRGCTATCP